MQNNNPRQEQSRRQSREAAFKLAYQLTVNGTVSDIQPYDGEQSYTSHETEFSQIIFKAMIARLGEIDDLIKNAIKDFEFERLFKLDLAILRLAVAEFLLNISPSIIIIDSAVDMAKKYSTEKSTSFINGVLASITQV